MKNKNNSSDKKECLECKKERRINDFYKHDSPIYSDKKYPICKICIKNKLKLDNPLSQEALDSVKDVMLDMNKPFIYSLYLSSIEESKKTGKKDIFGLYKKNVDQNHSTGTWKDSEFENGTKELSPNNEIISKQNEEDFETEIVSNTSSRDKQDVIRMLGYDPFEFESPEDKKHLYNRLVDFLDESTLEDGFKLQAVIEIVKGFNQIDKINRAITNLTNDIKQMSSSSGGIKSLIDAKKNILTSLIKLAEDNGISVKHNNQKSKGAGTLSGIIKSLNEKGIKNAEINVFDVETCEGMRQVADISNKSILEQLMLNENDYTEMIKDQHEMIKNYDKRLIELEEENRLLKIKLKEFEVVEKEESQQ